MIQVFLNAVVRGWNALVRRDFSRLVFQGLCIAVLMLFSSFVRAVKSSPKISPLCVESLRHLSSRMGGKRVLVVDGYSSGAAIARKLRKMGVKDVFHFHSNPNGLPPAKLKGSYRPSDYSRRSFRFDNYEDALATAKSLGVDAVMVGSEGDGVEIAERLRRDLGLRSEISDELIRARRQKYETSELVRNAGLEAVYQKLTGDVEEALEWVRQTLSFEDGVILKPPASGGADNVVKVYNEKDFRKSFEVIRHAKNVFGQRNNQVLVQEFLMLDGKAAPEFAVNFVSSRGRQNRGRHKLADIWKYTKNEQQNGAIFYGHDLLLDSQGELQDELVSYVQKVMDVLQIDTGWSHVEVMMTNRGPVLIELNNRLMGASQHAIVEHAQGGIGPVEYGIWAHLEPDIFDQLPDRYVFEKGVAVVTINSFFKGRVLAANAADLLRSLPGYVSHSFSRKPGQNVLLTKDLLTSMGHVELVNSNLDELEDTIKTLERWQREGRLLSLPPKP